MYAKLCHGSGPRQKKPEQAWPKGFLTNRNILPMQQRSLNPTRRLPVVDAECGDVTTWFSRGRGRPGVRLLILPKSAWRMVSRVPCGIGGC